jgi:hypothetical protein
MATDRQIAANRRNAGRSTGPRSLAGKNRASRNSYRHGLSANVISNAEYQMCVANLARKFAGQSRNPIILEYARMAAEAELEQARFARAKVELIHSTMAFGNLKPPRGYAVRLLQHLRLRRRLALGHLTSVPNPKARVPRAEPECSTKAIRRALPELLRLEHYARRADGRRERALRIVCAGRAPGVNP